MATIVMASDNVIHAAKKIIEHIERERERRDEEAIASRMQPRSFMGFKLKARTREEAIKSLDSDSNMWGWRSQYAWGDLSKAKDLLKLAQHGDPVTLNENDIGVLF